MVSVKLYVPDQERLLGAELERVNRFTVGINGARLRIGDASERLGA